MVCDTQARTVILLSRMALEQLQTWQDYGTNTMYIKQTAIPLYATQKHEVLPGRKVVIKSILLVMFIPHHIYRVMEFAGYGQTIHLNLPNP